MSRNDFVDNERESLESKVNYIVDSADHWQQMYEETLEDGPDQKEVEEIVEGYAVMMEQVQETYKIMKREDYNEFADIMLDTFEEVSETQSEYAEEVRELVDNTPLDLFKEKYEME